MHTPQSVQGAHGCFNVSNSKDGIEDDRPAAATLRSMPSIEKIGGTLAKMKRWREYVLLVREHAAHLDLLLLLGTQNSLSSKCNAIPYRGSRAIRGSMFRAKLHD